MTEREVIVPLTEPVSIEKALLGGREARVSTSIEGSSAAFLVNIQLTGWNNTKEYNEGYARGFNNAAEWMQKAIAKNTARVVQAARAAPADHSSYALQMLVAAGHIPQAKVDEASAIAAKIPGVGEAQSVRDADHITNDEVRNALAEMGLRAADLCEISTASLRRWIKALRGAYYKGYAEAGYDAAERPVDAQSVRDAWISVDERLPEHEGIVLATGWKRNEVGGERYHAIAHFHRQGSFYEEESGDELYPPTHWQPLPAPPHKPVSDEVKP